MPGSDRAPRAAADGGDPASPGDGDPDSGWALDGSSDAGPDEALDAAELDETADADEGGPATIYGIEFDVQEDHDRIVVLSEQPVDYLVYEPDPETVVVSIEGAVIEFRQNAFEGFFNPGVIAFQGAGHCTLGGRPNSPPHQTIVLSSRPRSVRSCNSVASPESISGSFRRMVSECFLFVSQPL